jgi:hypothetical protein
LEKKVRAGGHLMQRTIAARLLCILIAAALLTGIPRTALALGTWAWFWNTSQDANPRPYSECQRRATAALQANGLSVAMSMSNPDTYRGESDSSHAMIMCVQEGRGFYMILDVVAANGSADDAHNLGNAINASFWGTVASSGCDPRTPVGGTWNWWDGTGTVTFYGNGTAAHSSGWTGQWVRNSDGSYRVYWARFNSNDYFTISPDGRSMPGNFNGHSGTATRTC